MKHIGEAVDKRRYRYCNYCVVKLKRSLMDCPQCGKCYKYTCPKCGCQFDKEGEEIE